MWGVRRCGSCRGRCVGWNRSGVWGVVCWEVGVGGGAWCVGGGGVCERR